MRRTKTNQAETALFAAIYFAPWVVGLVAIFLDLATVWRATHNGVLVVLAVIPALPLTFVVAPLYAGFALVWWMPLIVTVVFIALQAGVNAIGNGPS